MYLQIRLHKNIYLHSHNVNRQITITFASAFKLCLDEKVKNQSRISTFKTNTYNEYLHVLHISYCHCSIKSSR